jgi:hypothetical protein
MRSVGGRKVLWCQCSWFGDKILAELFQVPPTQGILLNHCFRYQCGAEDSQSQEGTKLVNLSLTPLSTVECDFSHIKQIFWLWPHLDSEALSRQGVQQEMKWVLFYSLCTR